jgi:hypothetical protein
VKTLRQVCAATILSLMLAVSAFAGHMETTGAPAPDPATNSTTTNVATSVVLTILNVIYS